MTAAEWAHKWIEIGLRTGPAEREKFAKGAEACYRAAGVAWPGNVVWAPSSMVLKLAAPVAAAVIELRRQRLLQHVVNDAVRDLVDCAVHRAVGDDAVGQTVRRAVLDAVNAAVRDVAGSEAAGAAGQVWRRPWVAIGDDIPHDMARRVTILARSCVDDAVAAAVRNATYCVESGVRNALDHALHRAACDGFMPQAISVSARRAAGGAVNEAVDYYMAYHAVAEVLQNALDFPNLPIGRGDRAKLGPRGNRIHFFLGWGGFNGLGFGASSASSFYREVCGLELGEGAPAREATLEAAHLWCSHLDFVMACERPAAIRREPAQESPWHVLHCADGPAIAYQDGWGVYALHGVDIPFRQRHIVEQPEAITAEAIGAEENAELRRVMIDRYSGPARFVADGGAAVVCGPGADHPVAGLPPARQPDKDAARREPVVPMPGRQARMARWEALWTAVGLRTGTADREKFAKGAQGCYRAAGLAWPGHVVWTPSPMVLKLAAPLAAAAIALRRHRMARHVVNEAVRDLVDYVAHRAVGDDAVGQSVRRAVLDAVNAAVRGAAGDDAADDAERHGAREPVNRVPPEAGGRAGTHALPDEVRRIARCAARHCVNGAVAVSGKFAMLRLSGGGVRLGVDVDARSDLMLHGIGISARRAAGGAVDEAVDYGMAFYVAAEVLENAPGDGRTDGYFHGSRLLAEVWKYSGGSIRAVCGLYGLEVGKGGSAYKAALKAAHLWYPHHDFVMACERPTAIHREPPSSTQENPWHALHCDDGPAIAYQDGWGVYAVHGVEIPFWQRHIVERPETITAEEIEEEKNTEIRRVMIDRYGPARYVADSGATVVDELDADHPIAGLRTGRLLCKDVPDHEPIIYADLLNSTLEPDGTHKRYMLRIDPNAYDGEASRNLQAAVASTWRNADGSLYFADWHDYAPAFES